MKYASAGLLLFVLVVLGVWWTAGTPEKILSFQEECLADGNMWHVMQPMQNGEATSPTQAPGCMSANGLHHFVDAGSYRAAKNPSPTEVLLEEDATAGEPARLRFTLRTREGAAPVLFREHDRFFHVIIMSRDLSVHAHVHPDDQSSFSPSAVESGAFEVSYTFPKSGEYLVAVDYAHMLRHQSEIFHIRVDGSVPQHEQRVYDPVQKLGPLQVALTPSLVSAGTSTTLRFDVRDEAGPVTDLVPYLGAAMHLAVVRNDFQTFQHAHGEVHANASTQEHGHAPPPATFGPTIESHVFFPAPGRYTVFAEFKRGSAVSVARFTVDAE